MDVYLSNLLVIAGVLILPWVWKVFNYVWWRPKMLERTLKKQGIHGPPYKLLSGNIVDNFRALKEAQAKPMGLSHQIVPRVAPFHLQTVKNYGKTSVTWFGTKPRVNIMDPELIKEVLSNKFGHFAKPKQTSFGKQLVGGLVVHEGEKWAKHRRIINPAFHVEKLKRMLPAFSASCSELVSKWEQWVGSEESRELDVWPDLQALTGDVISRSGFGSSYKEGRRVFQLLTEQAELFIQAVHRAYIPGYQFFPTKDNLRRKEIDREVRAIMRSMIEKRGEAMKTRKAGSDDLLGLLMESNFKESQEQGNSSSMSIEDVIEECRLFYFAGQETTSSLLTWTMIVLSMHPSWQERARKEVLQVFGKNKPDFDGLSHLKIVTMILYEVLRLYPPATLLTRRTYKRMQLGGITLPADVEFTLPILLMHHDPKLWGEDADEFKPERFSGGVSKATNNQVSFFPFGWGPRICIGQNFAMMESKLALAMILQRFSSELSPSYVHAPYTVITLRPQYGAQLILRKL
ncbi:cytochrome P450 CYP72A616-like isoform X6 [Magnolia sinica]|uniref:cytochrome P450 CYP72A616-like isoform X6 n=1 Tax=Magnolia sinica TaxID=86752 RepID=UPI00265A9AFA|nr:cytochrome P450 CYP72A616-like isoform X6 [Magnolia sinica]